MRSYHYLISSLPTLKANEPMPFTYEHFLDMCKNCVDASTYRILENLDFTSTDGSFFRKWNSFYGQLIEKLNNLRKEKLGKGANSNIVYDSNIEACVNAAMNAKDPLEAEHILLKAEFDYLDEMVSMHFFDATVLFGYALKMKLLERQSLFIQTEGQKEFERLFNGIQQQILNI